MEKILSIIIPCFNEEKNIPLLLERFQQALNSHVDKVELILVNNGSTDNSKNVFSKLIPKYKFARYLTIEKNQGYGYGILTGLREAEGKFLGWTHADLQTDPGDLTKALELLEKENYSTNIYIKGIRRGRSLVDLFFTIGMSLFESIYLRTRLWDINAQPNIFSRQFYELWQNPPYDFALDLFAYYQAKKQRYKVKRFSVRFPVRIHGVSSWNTSFKQKLKFIIRTLDFSRSLKKSLASKGIVKC